MEYLIQCIMHYTNIAVMIYLFGVLLSSFLYVPYRVARNNLKGHQLFLTIVGCFLWPVVLPLLIIVIPVVLLFKLMVKNFTITKMDKKEKEDDERETVPFKLNPKFMNTVVDKRK